MYKLVLYLLCSGLNVESMKMPPGTQTDAQTEDTTMLYITNLPYKCDTERLREKFYECNIIPKSVRMPLTKNGQTMGIAFVEIPRSIEMLPNNLIKKISTEWRRIPVIEVMERMRSDHANAANGIKYTFGDTSQGIADAWGTTLSWQEAWIPPRVNLPSRLSPELARSLMQNSNYGAFHWR